MRISTLFFAFSLGGLIMPSLLLAASSNFTINTFVGSDTTPPTTPALLTVVPVAATQIDITWSAATDDVLVAGYRLFRDSVQVATTTLLSYNDTGLSASTTYSYTVDAFDSFGNISSTSLSLATTTWSLPALATTSTSSVSSNQSGTRSNLLLQNLDITTTDFSAVFTWQTSGPTQYTLAFGRTSAYELGSVSGVVFSVHHLTTLTNLEPGTTYYYQLRATSPQGIEKIIATDRFTTQSTVAADTLPNVQGFKAQVQNNQVALSWRNPFQEQPNYYVRVVRSHLFYPASIQSGAVVYQGRSESFTDTEALQERSPQYYTIFVLDGSGRVSSGAVVRAKRAAPAGGAVNPDLTTPTPILPADMGDDLILKATDISIFQQEQVQVFTGEITLDQGLPYLISIPYTAVPKNLKSIIVSVQNPTNQKEVSAYLLKLNQAGDAYTAQLPKTAVVGTARIMVEVFDYEQETVRRISTSIVFVNTPPPRVPLFPDRILIYGKYFIATAIALGFIWWGLLLGKRRSRQID